MSQEFKANKRVNFNNTNFDAVSYEVTVYDEYVSVEFSLSDGDSRVTFYFDSGKDVENFTSKMRAMLEKFEIDVSKAILIVDKNKKAAKQAG